MTFSPSCCHFLHRLFLYNLDRRDSRDENLSNSVVKTLTRMLIHFSSRYVTRSKGGEVVRFLLWVENKTGIRILMLVRGCTVGNSHEIAEMEGTHEWSFSQKW